MSEAIWAVTLDLWLTLIEETSGGQVSAERRRLRPDGTMAVLADYGEFFERSQAV